MTRVPAEREEASNRDETNQREVARRRFLALAAATSVVGVAGCSGSSDDGSDGDGDGSDDDDGNSDGDDGPGDGSDDDGSGDGSDDDGSGDGSDDDEGEAKPNGSWPAYKRDSANTSANTDESGPIEEPTERWVEETDSDRGVTPTLLEDVVLTGGNRGYAYDRETGDELWGTDDQRGYGYGEVGASTGPDAVFVAANANIAALELEDGSTRWQVDAEAEFHDDLEDDNDGYPHPTYATVYAEELVYVQYGPGIFALDPESGDREWFYDHGAVHGEPYVPAVADGVCCSVRRSAEGTGDGGVVALDAADGSELWTEDFGGTSEAGITVTTIGGGRVYVPELASGDADYLRAYDVEDGSVEWEVEDPLVPETGFAYADETLYYRDEDDQLVAVDATDGEEIWVAEDTKPEEKAVGPPDEAEAPIGGEPSVSDEFVYCVLTSPAVAAFDREDGERVWTYEFDEDETDASPESIPVFGDGVLYVQADGGRENEYLYALE